MQRPRRVRRAARGVGRRRDPRDGARAHPRPATRRRAATWTSFEPGELAGRRVVILGHGSIGTAVADRLRPFGVQIVGIARTARDGVLGMEDLDGVLPTAEILVDLLPLTSETLGLLDGRRLALLPDGALVVNAGRGRTIDTGALVARARARPAARRPRRHRPGAAAGRPPAVGAAERRSSRRTSRVIRRRRRSAPIALAGDQVRRLAAGEPLINQVARYLLEPIGRPGLSRARSWGAVLAG